MLRLAPELGASEAGGSLGELLRSGTLGDLLREKMRSAIPSALQKGTDPGVLAGEIRVTNESTGSSPPEALRGST